MEFPVVPRKKGKKVMSLEKAPLQASSPTN
jgi:hypothetical protein